MNRRLFLQFPFLAPALITEAQSPAPNPPQPEPQQAQPPHTKPPQPPHPKKGFKVQNKQDRYQEELVIMGGQFDCKVSSKDTNGQLLIYDTYRDEKGGPALHFHHNQDEWFYVFSGEFIVKVGEDTLHLKAGDSAFAPRKIPHAFAKISEGPAQMMVLFQPAGSMEDFFKQMSKLGKSIPKDQEKKLKELWHAHGMEIVGPPLKF